MITEEKQLKLPEGYDEVLGPQLFEFEHIGDTAFGTLENIEPCEIKGKPGISYFVRNGKRVFKIHATADLKQKISPAHIGKSIVIIYESDDAAAGQQGNPMRRFKVGVKGE